MRQKIGIGIDDVLARNAEGFVAYSNKRWHQELKTTNYSEDWATFWGVPPEEVRVRTKDIHLSGVFGKYRHFPGIFQAIDYVGIWDSGTLASHQVKQTKAELCRELGVYYLIDDQIKHCAGAAAAGLKALLFGEYTWNRADGLPSGVARAKDWTAVLEYFDEQG